MHRDHLEASAILGMRGLVAAKGVEGGPLGGRAGDGGLRREVVGRDDGEGGVGKADAGGAPGRYYGVPR
ncbi:MAG: hypothetical protein ACREJR_10005 [Candidatus Rokuibacteriota bacterium]